MHAEAFIFYNETNKQTNKQASKQHGTQTDSKSTDLIVCKVSYSCRFRRDAMLQYLCRSFTQTDERTALFKICLLL